MAIDLKKCRETKAGNIITPKGRMMYAQFLFKPNEKSKTRKGEPKYTLSLVVPPDADISLLKKAAERVATEELGAEKLKQLVDMKRFQMPWLDAFEKSRSEKNPAGEDWQKGWVLFRTASTRKPQIVDPRGKDIGGDESEVYSGRWACISLRPFAWEFDGKYGVSFGLQNVQLLDHDEPIAGGAVRAEDEFEPVEPASGSEPPSGGESAGASADSVFN